MRSPRSFGASPTHPVRVRTVRLLALAFVVCGASGLWAEESFAATVFSSNVFAGTPFTRYHTLALNAPEVQKGETFGTRVVAAGDLTGDGVPDFFVDALGRNVEGKSEAGKVYLFSGADRDLRSGRSPVYELNSPEVQSGANFGFFVSVPGDLNRDGRSDVVIGANAQNVNAGGDACLADSSGCNNGQGKAWVFSGQNGRLLFALNDPEPQPKARFGSRIGSAGDVTGDGVPDILVGASNQDNPARCSFQTPVAANCHRREGAAFIFNGANGALVRTLRLPAADEAPAPCSSACGGLGLTVQSPGDIDQDGVPDQLVDASSVGSGRLYVFSGKDGSVLRRIDDPVPQPDALFGFDVQTPSAPGDVNGDGTPDIYGSGFNQDGPTGQPSAGRAWVFSGKDGSVLYEIKDPSPGPGQGFGFAMTDTNYDNDGRPDLYVGASPHEGPPGVVTDQNGETHIFSGRDGSLLKDLLVPAADRQPTLPDNSGPNLGTAVAAPGDINADGMPDYVGGAFLYDAAGNQDQGRVYVFRSHVGPVVTGFRLTNRTFAAGGGSNRRLGRAPSPRGTVFRYTLSKAATVRIRIVEDRSGRLKGTLTRRSPRGADSVMFSGRIGARALSPGAYRATLIATDAARIRSTPAKIAFTVVRG